MPAEAVERKLVAILAADVVGYSRLVGLDEEGTLPRLKALRRENHRRRDAGRLCYSHRARVSAVEFVPYSSAMTNEKDPLQTEEAKR
jgi:hypothetical protein